MNINELLAGVKCGCGRFHRCDIKYVYVENNAAARLTEICEKYENILIVADGNTYRSGGRYCEEYIAGKNIRRVLFPSSPLLVPNEAAIERVTSNLGNTELIIGIGSGVIQDLCKYVSQNSGVPYIVYATAPSMDGYASSGAAMITGGMKVTYPAGVPMAILADTEVIRNAPTKMIKAGYGDIIGKYSALNDWKLGAVVNNEYFCDYIYDLTENAVKTVLPLAKNLLMRDGEAVKTLMEALILVGVAMSFAGNSRPASGSEHHLSHYFEITGIIDSEDYLPHGIDVVFSTAVTSIMREKLINAKFCANDFRESEEERISNIQRVYKSVAEGCIELQNKLGTYEDNRSERYKENEDKIKEILKEAPKAETIASILEDIELDPTEFFTVYSEEKIADAVVYAKDLKDRYTVLWMYYDVLGKEPLDA